MTSEKKLQLVLKVQNRSCDAKKIIANVLNEQNYCKELAIIFIAHKHSVQRTF